MKNWRFVLKYMGYVKWTMLFAMILLMMESVASLAIIGLQKLLIDDVLWPGHYDQAAEVIWLFVAAFVSQLLLFSLGPHIVNKATSKVEYMIGKEFISKVYKKPIAEVLNERTATYVHYLSNDVDKVSHLAAYHLPRGFQHVFAALLLMGVIGYASPVILLVTSVVSIAYLYLGRVFAPKLQQAAKEVQEAKSKLLVHIEEGISSTREVLAYHRLVWEERVYRLYFGKYYDKVMQEGKMENWNMISSEPLNWGVRLLILGYGGYLVLENHFSLGMFVIVFQFGSQLVETFQGIFRYSMLLAGSSASVERVRTVMEEENGLNDTQALALPVSTIQFQDVRFQYAEDERLVLDDLNMNIPVGQKTAIVGTSGGGKSTIAKLLIRFYDPVSGKIEINGQVLNRIEKGQWMEQLAVVPQEPYLYPDTILENLLMGQEGRSIERIREACQVAQIHDHIMSLPQQYETVIGDRGITLSGGQRQRLAIARALIREPEVLILDEATSALDLTTERLLQGALDTIRQGKTTIIIAHRLSTIRNADMIYVIDQGKAVENGTHQQLIAQNGIYKQLVFHEEKEGKTLSS